MLLREYPVERWFVIPPLLANVSALPGGNMYPLNFVFSVMLGIHGDHPRRQIKMKVCILTDLQETVLSFGFHRNWLSGFVAVGGRNLPFLIDFTKLMEKRQNQCERANFVLFISSRQYLVMEYSILLSVTHVYQVCHRVVGHGVKNVCCSSSSLVKPTAQSWTPLIIRSGGWLVGWLVAV